MKIEIEGFRGILNEDAPLVLNLKPERVNSIYASNSIGKSSIFDALCFAIKGGLPRFSDYQAREKSHEYLCNHFHTKGISTVTLTFQSDAAPPASTVITVKCDRSGSRTVSSPSGHPAPEAFLGALDEEYALLDYRTFQKFLEDDANTRGRAFAKVLGLSSYSSFRQSLQACGNTTTLNNDFGFKVLETKISGAKAELQTRLQRAKAHFETLTGKTFHEGQIADHEADVINTLSRHALLAPFLSDAPVAGIDYDAMKEGVRAAEGGDDRLKLQQALERIAELENLAPTPGADLPEQENLGSPVSSDLADSRARIQALVDEREAAISETSGELFKALFDAANVLLEKGQLPANGECPLCSSIPSVPLSELIKGQSQNFALVAQKSAEIRDLWPEEPYIKWLTSLEECIHLDVPPEQRPIRALAASASTGSISKDAFGALVSRSDELEILRSERLSQAQSEKVKLEDKLPKSLVELTEAIEDARQFSEALAEYRAKYPAFKADEASLARYGQWKDFINDASTVFADAEERLTKTRLDGLKIGYTDFFKALSGVDDITPVLSRQGANEQLHITLSDFHGATGQLAKAVLAESYRNALAISIFLAAALKHSQNCRFIVLDDVTSSFDGGHQNLLMELLRTRVQQPAAADGLQVIILSHDSMLEKYFDRMGTEPGVAWHHQKLHGLSPTGMVLTTQFEGQRLAAEASAQIAAGNLVGAQSLVRQYAEFKLLQIITKLKIPVPIDFAVRDDKKMMGGALDAIKAAMQLNKVATGLVLTPQQEADFHNIHMPAVMGNFVSHYTSGSSVVLAGPVLSAAIQAIDAVGECFRYDDLSGAAPVRRWYKSLSEVS